MRDEHLTDGISSLVLAMSAVPVLITGSVAQEPLARIRIPAGLMGPGSAIRQEYMWSATNSANNKLFRVQVGGIAGFGQQTLGFNETTGTVPRM
jgi:hypothetical protein